MLAQISYKQLKEWQAFETIEPFGDEWRQASLVAWAAAKASGSTKIEPAHFMPAYLRQPPPRQQTPEEQQAILIACP